jgi:molecular chaperone GrpE
MKGTSLADESMRRNRHPMKIPVNKGNAKTEVDARGPALDVDHELPAGEPGAPEASSGAPAPESELQRVQAERDSLFDRLARQQAEFDNYRKRASREQQDFRQYAVSDALKQFLPVLDSFERALATPPNDGRDEKLRAGVELVRKQMLDTLTRLGVTPIEAEGAVFDPQFHEAVEMVDTNDAKDNHVISELQRGYRLKDRLLRPAMVRVARNPEK